jgi:hypothetical protein
MVLELSSDSLKKFEVLGGLVSGTEESRGKISLDRPNRQWDYPYAWWVSGLEGERDRVADHRLQGRHIRS